MSADNDYEQADAEITKALERGATSLDLSRFKDLKDLPPAISKLSQLQHLMLTRTRIEKIDKIAGLRALRQLDLTDTPVIDFTPIATLEAMRCLELNGTQIKDVSVLDGLSYLTELYLSNTQVETIAPLAAPTGAAELERLDLTDTKVSDLTPLAKLFKLHVLKLDRTQVHDLSPLSELEQLTTLELRETDVEDISALRGLTRLNDLALDHTKVADLRPIAGHPFSQAHRVGLSFQNTPAAASSPEMTALSQTPDAAVRTKRTLEHLKTLPPWPDSSEPQDRRGYGLNHGRDHDGQSKRQESNGLPVRLSRLSLSKARAILEQDYPVLRDRCAYVVSQLNETLADQIPTKPNDPAKLREWEHLVRTLELSRTAMVTLHDALPEDLTDRPVTNEDANRLKTAFAAAIERLQSASRYIDQAEEEHGRTYGGLLKIGICMAVASPLAHASGTTFAIAAGAVHVMLYGSGKYKDAQKLFGGSG